jgi:putative heme degradation protein
MITSPDAAHRQGCGCGVQSCAARPQPPRSYAELMALGVQACRLDADAETLALILPLFGRPSASTLGPYALLNERGAYGPAQLAGRNPRRSCARLALRLAPGHGEVLICTAADPDRRIPAALHLFDAAGAILHRTEIAAPEDLVTLDAVTRQLGTDAAPLAPPLAARDPSGAGGLADCRSPAPFR